jgi:hypothetical protein
MIWTFLLAAILSAYLRVGYVLPLVCGSFGCARFYVRPNAASHRFSALHNDEGSAIVSEWGLWEGTPGPQAVRRKLKYFPCLESLSFEPLGSRFPLTPFYKPRMVSGIGRVTLSNSFEPYGQLLGY